MRKHGSPHALAVLKDHILRHVEHVATVGRVNVPPARVLWEHGMNEIEYLAVEVLAASRALGASAAP